MVAEAPNSASSGWLMTTSARSSGLISSCLSIGLMPAHATAIWRQARLTRHGSPPILPRSMTTDARDPHFRHSYTKDKHDLVTRLRRIEGQARGIQRLVDEEAYCLDVLQQVEALTAAADQVALL